MFALEVSRKLKMNAVFTDVIQWQWHLPNNKLNVHLSLLRKQQFSKIISQDYKKPPNLERKEYNPNELSRKLGKILERIGSVRFLR